MEAAPGEAFLIATYERTEPTPIRLQGKNDSRELCAAIYESEYEHPVAALAAMFHDGELGHVGPLRRDVGAACYSLLLYEKDMPSCPLVAWHVLVFVRRYGEYRAHPHLRLNTAGGEGVSLAVTIKC
jgi:hypothetical protein